MHHTLPNTNCTLNQSTYKLLKWKMVLLTLIINLFSSVDVIVVVVLRISIIVNITTAIFMIVDLTTIKQIIAHIRA